ncbi:MAG: acylneuraminate cytidylyltransferase family protein [Lachnospiraceae bacterium]|nr:acylneuraminate cytidylyltransferase family protein [Lachnospiraceae bacterium]
MKNIAFIPARGGSRSIPFKNIAPVGGKPLIYWTLKAAHESVRIEKTFVSTDSDRIRETVLSFGFPDVEVVSRSAETASDMATTESAMLEFAKEHTDFQNICLIQATSPLLTAEDLDGGFELYEKPETDSVFSGNRKYQFLWKDDGDYAKATYDILHRPRRQDYPGYIVENGAFYITGRDRLLETGCRFSGRIRVYEMKANRIFEIDEPEDFDVIAAIMAVRDK